MPWLSNIDAKIVSPEVATTQWSQVLAARDGSDTEARQALEELCQTYWLPLYAYVRRQGESPEDARDLTQAYFTELLDKDFLASVDPSKGRFRAVLLASLRNFLSHHREREGALKRGGGAVTFSLDVDTGERAYEIELDRQTSPEDVFEYRWAMTVFDRALGRLEQQSIESGTRERFDHLKTYLTSADRDIPYREVATTLGVTEAAVNSAVQRLRKRLGRCLRDEIAQTVVSPTEIDDEVRHLLAVIRP